MKRMNWVCLLGFSAIAATTAAHAQSNVTIYGILDASVAYAKGEKSKSGVRSGDLVASRLGFRGTEVISPDLKVLFNLEAGLNLDTGAGFSTNTNNQASGVTPAGALTFNRQAWVGLASNWGEVRAGRLLNLTFRQYNMYDPFMGGGPAVSQAAHSSLATYGYGPAGIRHSNAIEYALPRGKALGGELMYATGNNPSGAEHRSDGDYMAGRLMYQWGGANIGVAAGKMHNHTVRNIHELVIGTKYKFTKSDVTAMYTHSKTGLGKHQTGWLVGGTLHHEKMEYRASLSTSTTKDEANSVIGRTHKLAAVAAYNFSKRSAVYVMGAYTRNSRGAALAPLGALTAAETGVNGNARFMSVGVVHKF